MPQVLAPGVAQANLNGSRGTQPWTCVTHWKFDGITAAWTATDMQLLADTLSSAWNTYASPHCDPSVQLTSVTTVDIGTTTPAVGANNTTHLGTSSGSAIPNSATCTLISCRIAARYRGGHPRIYLPWGVQADSVNESGWSSVYQQNAAVAWTNIVSNIRVTIPPISGAQVSHVAVRYNYSYVDDAAHHKYSKLRESLNGVFIVQNYVTNPVFGTQRRRLTQG